MRRNVIVATISAIIISLGITYQVTATTSHDIKDETPAATAETQTEGQPPGTTTPNLPATTPPQQNQEQAAQNREGETSDHTGKPGEVKP